MKSPEIQGISSFSLWYSHWSCLQLAVLMVSRCCHTSKYHIVIECVEAGKRALRYIHMRVTQPGDRYTMFPYNGRRPCKKPMEQASLQPLMPHLHPSAATGSPPGSACSTLCSRGRHPGPPPLIHSRGRRVGSKKQGVLGGVL